MPTSILITGANSGLGKETARQFALRDETEKIYLACRNPQKAEQARKSLESETGKSVFEIVILDTSDPESVRQAVDSLKQPVDALILNAGGMGGKNPGVLTPDGVTEMFAVNVLGHAVLVEELIKEGKLSGTVLYAGSEAARGVGFMGMKRPGLSSYSVEEISSIMDGSYFGANFDPNQAYGHVKFVAALWMASMARRHPELRFVTISPGGTVGTEVAKDMPLLMRLGFKYLGSSLLPLLGVMHKLETGAKRYMEGILDDTYQSGIFYASKMPGITGPVVDQGTFFEDLYVEEYQDHAHQAISNLIARRKLVV